MACTLICQVLQGLDHAHGLGFVHRDIKPANVLVSREEGGLVGRLADFGLAKKFENAGFSSMTQEGALLGTVPFMPPEQIVDARLVRPSVDLYSVGATLYHLLADHFPHDFTRSKDPRLVVLRDDPTPLRHHCPWVPEGLADHVRRALARDAADRFATAWAMREALLPFGGER
jgi:serine/threonine protein kinase